MLALFCFRVGPRSAVHRVRSGTPIGRFAADFAKRRSIALVVLTCLRSASDLYCQQVSSSSRSSRRQRTALGYHPASGRRSGGGRTRPRQGRGVHHRVQIGFDRRLVGDPHLAEDVADFVRPAALHRDARIGGRQCGQETRAAVGADHLERSPLSPRRIRSPRKRSHSAALSLWAKRKSMTSFLPSERRPSATKTGRRMRRPRSCGPRRRHPASAPDSNP